MMKLVIGNIPLKIIRPRVFVLAIRAERTNVAWRIMHEPVSDHLIFSLESLTFLSSRTAHYGAEMWPVFRMYVCMRTKATNLISPL